jgi:predicted nucleotidyltransferase
VSQAGDPIAVAEGIADCYRLLPQVRAVILAGSRTTSFANVDSDVDLYVYTETPVPLVRRAHIARARSEHAEVGNFFWEPGDEWVEAGSGVRVDVMFRRVAWIEEQLARVLIAHHASVGYSTCVWHNVVGSRVLFDRYGWFADLQAWANQPYPESLRRAIVAKNQPILCATQSSYRHQIELAIARGDLVSVNHRIAALLASYFDILFAVNRLPHPGEKRLLEIAVRDCPIVPAQLEEQISGLIGAMAQPDSRLIERIDALIDRLEQILRSEGLLPLFR